MAPTQVWQANDPEERAFVQSLLDEAGIAYEVRSEPVQDIFGIGQIGGFNVLVGGIRIMVDERDRQRARELLEGAVAHDASEAAPELAVDPADTAPGVLEADKRERRALRWSQAALLGVLILSGPIGGAVAIVGGIGSLLYRPRRTFTRILAILSIVLGLAMMALLVALMGQNPPLEYEDYPGY